MHSLPMRLLPILCLTLASALVAACSGDRNSQAQPAVQAPEPAAAPVQAPAVDADALARYDCGAGVSVILLKNDKARATIPGQPTVDLGKIADSTPSVYTGANLYFDIGDGDAHLSQEDGTELACQRQ